MEVSKLDTDGAAVGTPSPWPADSPDRRDGLVYVMPDEVGLAIDVALATKRPLLLRGEPGCGKSSLAAYIARIRGWRYYEHVVTSRTKGGDLLWTYDHIRRLSDAQVREKGTALTDDDYVTPGPLWWALDPASAAVGPKAGARRTDPWHEVNENRSPSGAVVLIDEIDKADPDMPNSLLVPLGSRQFTVSETGQKVGRKTAGEGSAPSSGSPLVIITTNEERELPQAFLRRCVVASLPEPDVERLVEIAAAHYRGEGTPFGPADERLALELAQELDRARSEARRTAVRTPSTAEYLDALRACTALGIDTEDSRWSMLKSLTLIKPQQPEL